jgi:plastocyanin domain-containing protein
MRSKSFRSAFMAVGAAAVLAIAGTAVAAANASSEVTEDVPKVRIQATSAGFAPDTVRLVSGAPADLVFTRTGPGSGCVAQVHIPALGVAKTSLPLDQPVAIRVTPMEPGTFEFLCGMDMHRGTIVVKAATD